jgi:hypothetical protein
MLILAITAMMAVLTTMLTYFVDLLPSAIEETQVAAAAVERSVQTAPGD